jgi:DNA-directed RNA polymerase specialized sigma subunit
LGRLSEKTTEEIVREYMDCINRYATLSSKEESLLVERWKEGHPNALNFLICCNLRHVIYPARRAAWDWYEKHDYWPALRELIGAGNYGLVLAAERFRSDAGVRFCTAAKFSIRKEIIWQAKFHRSAVSRPYDVKFRRDVSPDASRGPDDREIEIAPSGTQKGRTLCIEPGDHGDTPQGAVFSELLSDGFAILKAPEQPAIEASHAKLSEDEMLCGPLDDLQTLLHAKANQILNDRERRIYLAPHLTPDEPIKLKALANELGISMARISQIGAEADKKVCKAIVDCESIVTPRFPPSWSQIEDWCDRRPKQLPTRYKLTFGWHVAERGKSIYRRERVEDPAVAESHGASDYNLNRVRAAIEAGTNPDRSASRSAYQSRRPKVPATTLLDISRR